MKKFLRQLAVNILAALVIFVISLTLYQGSFINGWKRYAPYALIFYSLHILVSLLFRKYEYHSRLPLSEIVKRYHRSWVVSSGTALLTLFLFQLTNFSRLILISNIFGILAAEYLLILFAFVFRESVPLLDEDEISGTEGKDLSTLKPFPEEIKEEEFDLQRKRAFDKAFPEIVPVMMEYCPEDKNGCLVLNSPECLELFSFPEEKFTTVVNTHPINRIGYLNHFLEVANSRLNGNGILLVCAETALQRKKRLLAKWPPLINRIYYFGDYLLMRVIPKLPPFRQIYFDLTGGKSLVLSRTEILGRLSAAGFTIHEELANNGKFCVAARKTGPPLNIGYATYGPVIHLRRIGKNGRMIKIYKLRTMYPYSEFIQEYVHSRHSLAKNGKFNNDFRVTTVGRFMRRWWIDELPGLWNWIRGDVKLVGVRPLSQHFFNLYSPELQQKRIQVKPGLIPPFYYDLPQSLDQIMDSEWRYLEQYEKAPVRTDIRYFFKALYNIVVKGAKSS